MVDVVETGRGPDADEVLRIGKITLDALREVGASPQKPLELLDALLRSTQSYIDDGISIDKAQFTAAELNARVKGQGEQDDSPEIARRYVNDNLSKLGELLQAQRAELDELLRASGIDKRLKVSKTGSKGRNKAHIFLDLEQLVIAGGRSDVIPSHFVRYRVSQLPKAPRWAKPFFNLTLEGPHCEFIWR